MAEDIKSEELKKKVDESWKESVSKDKTSNDQTKAKLPEKVTFGLFIYGLMMEALIALGEIENPITKKKEVSASHGKFIIDTLDMLKEKTKGNLSGDEDKMLDGMLYELRMKFVSKTQKANG